MTILLFIPTIIMQIIVLAQFPSKKFLLKIIFVDRCQEEFIKNLKFYRKEKGLSQEKLAELCNVSTSTIGCIESAHQNPSFELIVKIAEKLDVHPADLFLRDSSKIQNRELFSKYHELLLNCEHLPECHQNTVTQLVKSLAESGNNTEYKTSHK